jgi:hypothetical protein
LFLGILIGVGFMIRSEIEQRELLAEFRRLRGLTAALTVEDLDKIHVVAMPTEDPAEFAWRIYLPPGETYRWATDTNGAISSVAGTPDASADNHHFIARFRIAVHDGILQKFWVHPWGSSYNTFGSSDVARLFTSPQDHLEVRQLGDNGQLVFNRSEVVGLFELRFSERFRQQAREVIDDESMLRFVEAWTVRIRLGTEEAFLQADGKQDNPERNAERER